MLVASTKISQQDFNWNRAHFRQFSLDNWVQVLHKCNRLGMMHASHEIIAVSKPPTISVLQSLTMLATSMQAAFIFPSFAATVSATDSARPLADICWPSHFSFSACFISNFPHIIGFVFSWIFVSSLCFFCPYRYYDTFVFNQPEILSSPWISFHLGKPRLKFRQSYPLFGTFLDLNILSMP